MAELKKHRYHAVGGGPVKELFLPWPHETVPEQDHLPHVVDFGHGYYQRTYTPTADTYVYVWKDTPHAVDTIPVLADASSDSERPRVRPRPTVTPRRR